VGPFPLADQLGSVRSLEACRLLVVDVPYQQPMTLKEQFEQFTWVFPTCLNLLSLGLMVKAKLHRTFPIFSVYLASTATLMIVLAVIDRTHPYAYFYLYWISDGLTAILGLAVIYEVFKVVLNPFPSVQKVGLTVFRSAFVVLLVLVIATFRSREIQDQIPWISLILNLELSIRILEGGLFFFLFSFAASLGLTWKHHAFGIAAGLALFVASELTVVTMRTYLGRAADDLVFQILKPAAFNCGVLIWAAYIWRGKSVTNSAGRLPETGRIVQWNRALTEYLAQ
jgi:hypothetical protein